MNGAFSIKNPDLQVIWDATSLSTFKECPLKYYLSVVRGWTPKQAALALDFGIALHEALEHYFRRKASGMDFQENENKTLLEVLQSPYRKSIESFKDPDRNIRSLFFTVFEYLEHYRFEADETVILPDGTVGVELHFQFETPYKTLSGENISFAGHLDRLASGPMGVMVHDHKTSVRPLTEFYFKQYKPNTQMTLYTLCGEICYSTAVRGVIIDAINVRTGEFNRQPTMRTKEYCEEWLHDQRYWFITAEHCATTGHWPQNDNSCHKYSGCPFKEYCQAPRSLRESILEENFQKRIWDPSVPR